MVKANEDEALKQVNRSGFPFQLRVEAEVRSSSERHDWSVASREHPWVNPQTSSFGFIDLVLEHKQYSTFRMVIECKRVKADDARQLRWVFLLPDHELKPTEIATCLEVEGRANTHIQPPPLTDIRLWDNVRSVPASLQSEFCVLPNDEQRRQPILESLSVEVLESVEGLAQEEVSIVKSNGPPYILRLFIFPVIVTNAEIAVCRFTAKMVNIEDGTLSASNAEISSVPFIRFRKSLATGFPDRSVRDLQSASRARERTVFVVNAACISDFLSGWQVNPLDAMDGFAIQRIP